MMLRVTVRTFQMDRVSASGGEAEGEREREGEGEDAVMMEEEPAHD